MRRLSIIWILAFRLNAADPHVTPDERTKVLNWLAESRQRFLAAIEHVSDAQWKWKPSPERWSVGEVAEHIVKAEAGLFANVKIALATPADAEWERKTRGKTETIEMVMAPRLGKAVAPEPLVPGGKMTRVEAREQFEKLRAEIVKFAEETDAPLKEHLRQHPMPMFDPLNAYQWLIYVPLHTERHVKQIAEVKSTTGYPVE